MSQMLRGFGCGVLVLAAFCAGQGTASKLAEKLKITMPSEITIEQASVTLGSVCKIEGPVTLLNQACTLGLGSFVTKGQILYVDRNTMLSRLASAGIPAGSIEFAGAQIMTIKRKEAVVEPEQIVRAARGYLDKYLVGRNVVSVNLVRMPSLLVLNDPNAAMTLSCQMSRYQTPGTQKVTVTIQQPGQAILLSEVAFAVRYKTRRLVAAADMEAGTTVTSTNVRIEEVESSVADPGPWKEPYGLMVRRKIAQGNMIHSDWLAARESPVLIRRNQQVLVQLNTGALNVSAPGQALDEGKIGDLIRIRRGQRPDERIIYCTIQPDGTVRPQI
ncbi:MAG: flagellar basal body P-ring formation chaperone FlgA [Anaerohalosphaeraceae bacterium]